MKDLEFDVLHCESDTSEPENDYWIVMIEYMGRQKEIKIIYDVFVDWWYSSGRYYEVIDMRDKAEPDGGMMYAINMSFDEMLNERDVDLVMFEFLNENKNYVVD